jgi:hypothetical protein
MMDDAALNPEAATAAATGAADAAAPVSWSELWHWYAPWVLGAVLVLALFLGLVTAAMAADSDAETLGYVTAFLALLGLGWELNASLAGTPLPSLLVDTEEALGALLVLLAALAIGGLIAAARSDSSAVQSAGYALFLISLALAFGNLKHYYDRREAR